MDSLVVGATDQFVDIDRSAVSTFEKRQDGRRKVGSPMVMRDLVNDQSSGCSTQCGIGDHRFEAPDEDSGADEGEGGADEEDVVRSDLKGRAGGEEDE